MLPDLDFELLLRELESAPELATGEAVAFFRGTQCVSRQTYAELCVQAREVSRLLAEHYGVAPGDRLGLLSRNQVEVPAFILGALCAGAVLVPLNANSEARDWDHALLHSGARFLVASSEFCGPKAGLREFAGEVLALSELTQNSQAVPRAPSPSPAPPSGAARPDAPAVILYTSGTTGTPKGIELSQRHLLGNAARMQSCLELDHPIHLAVLPLYHAHALGVGLLTTLLARGRLVLMDGLDPFAWSKVIASERVTTASVVPHMLEMLSLSPPSRESLSTLRFLLVSSAPLAGASARKFEESTGVAVLHGWGLSEFTNFAVCLPPSLPTALRTELLWQGNTPCVGSALSGVQVSIRDGEGRPLAEGVEGELWLRGPTLMNGYFRDPGATENAVVAGWLRTGDLGIFRERDGERYYFITGRSKELVIRAGEKHSPLAIEARLKAALPAGAPSFAVVGFAHEIYGEEVGLVVQDEGLDPVVTSFQTAVAALPVSERPKVIVFSAAALPRTHTGKLRRNSLQALFLPFCRAVGKTKVHKLSSKTPQVLTV